MLSGFDAPAGVAATLADGIAEMARRQAAAMSQGELVAVFEQFAPNVVAGVRATGPIVIESFGNGTFPIAEAMSIAVLGTVVHGLDLCARGRCRSGVDPGVGDAAHGCPAREHARCGVVHRRRDRPQRRADPPCVPLTRRAASTSCHAQRSTSARAELATPARLGRAINGQHRRRRESRWKDTGG
jgi:hypothetical protein